MRTAKVDSRGRVTLGKHFANKVVEVKTLSDKTIVVTAIRRRPNAKKLIEAITPENRHT